MANMFPQQKFEYVLLKGICNLAEFRDPETGAHLDRMALYSHILAKHLHEQGVAPDGTTGSWVEVLFQAAPLHDIGKIAIPDRILLKPGKLTAGERQIMETHTLLGARFLEQILGMMGDDAPPFLRTAVDVCNSHHECWDGTGYPARLSGDNIPLVGRITAVADFYDALTNPRVYRPYALPHEEVRDMIVLGSGKHFDPRVVEAFQACEEHIRGEADLRKEKTTADARGAKAASADQARWERSEHPTISMETASLIPPPPKTQVLIVEDNLRQQHVMKQLLENRMGMETRIAEDIPTARALLKTQHFDLVVLDINLKTSETGLDYLQELAPKSPNTVVLMVSGVGDIKTVLKTIQQGAYDYLHKPFDLEEAEWIIRRTLDRQRLEQENVTYKVRLEQLLAQQIHLNEKSRDHQSTEN